ncbi:HEAT repeat domain-containing protein [Oscillatoria sp. HE19RPO]|uniref:HEAT repeat domain-containing protein n=1 Tax=Oscillatoria sp. HE19RPO TaxID=2954806 RepID=UPI0020C44DBB|nr:HEAT repeat domain-containing protein [Oscillatoria sp. HE19RPO]
MGETRQRGVRIHRYGKEKLTTTKATTQNYKGKKWTYADISRSAHVSESTVKRFFSGKEVDEESAIAICDALGLEVKDVVDLNEWNPPTPDEPTTNDIDWREVCETMLNRRLSSNLLTANEDINFNLDDIHVPLALVERRQRDKRPGETRAEEGSQLYEPTGYEEKQRFEHDQFLQDILGKGEGKTKGRQIAIIGEPGAGKTTLLQKIAFWILEERSDLPIWISLADLQGRGLCDYLLETWLKQAIPPSRLIEQVREDFLAELEQGRVWLLLDGVDEMATERATGGLPLQQIATQLKGWIASARVVLTCRVNVWEANLNALEAFETYRMLNFKYPTQVEAFIGKWFERSDATKGEALRQELAKAEYQRLQDLVKNPLRLTLLCSTWQTSEGLPETQAALYERFVEKIYQWKQNYFPTTEPQRQQLNHALGELARRGIDDAASPFRLRHQLVTEVLGDCDDDNSLFALALQLGWLNQVGVAAEDPDEKVYAFYHATFQEYFAALSIEDWDFFLPKKHCDRPVPGKRYRIFDLLWKQTILLWLGRKDVPKDKKEEFISRLVQFEDGCRTFSFYGFRAYFLATAGIAEFKECDRADEIIAQIVLWGFGNFNEEKQEWRTFLDPIASKATTVLGETEHIKATAALVNLIAHSEFRFNRCKAAERLGKIDPGNPEAIACLVNLIAHAEDEGTRWQAAESLGAIDPGNPEAIAWLVNLIAHAQDEGTRWRAAYNLGKIGAGNQRAIEALVHLISHSEDEGTRREAASSLGKIGAGNQTAIEALVNLIGHSEDEETRREAASSLEEIDPSNPEASTALINLIAHSEDEGTRREAAESLGEVGVGNPEVITELINLIAHSKDEVTRWQAASSLGKIGVGNPEVIAALANLIAESEDEDTRTLIVRNLEKIDVVGIIKAINVLAKLIAHSKDEWVRRRQAANSLEEIDVVGIIIKEIEVLFKLIADAESKYIRREAALSLDKIWTTEKRYLFFVTSLKDLLSDEIYKNDFKRFEKAHEVIWNSAQNLSYPEFYRAWHGEEEEVEPEPVSNLPQRLHAKLEEMGLSSSLQLICIDGSKFIDKDNPAAKIYNEMRRANCPKSADGTPKTMADLQSYWDELTLESEQPIVLVFYETLTAPEMSGFSEKFLTDLSKFDGAICVVTEARVSGLQTFSPNQGNWLAELVNWIKN